MKHKDSPDAGIGRRDFLVGTALTVGAVATMSASASRPLTVVKTSNPFFSVGFAEADGEGVAAADRLRSSFDGTTARVTIHGLWRGTSRRTPATIDVSAWYAVGARSVPYLAWSGSAKSASRPVSFRVPVDETGFVALGVEQRPGSVQRKPVSRLGSFFKVNPGLDEIPRQEKLVEQKSLCRLGTDAGDALKLRPGTYFIALLDEGDAAPNWHALSAGPVRSDDGVVLRRGDAPVDFDYLVVSINAA